MRLVTLAIAAATIAALAISTIALGGHQRPMKGGFTVGVVPVEQRCGPDALTIGFEGVGIATHLGRIEGSGSNCTEFSLATDAVAIWDGTAIFIAADGSTVTVSYEGNQDAQVAGKAIAVTTNTVVSGTGRFEDASGSWTTVGTLDFLTGEFSARLSGWIGY